MNNTFFTRESSRDYFDRISKSIKNEIMSLSDNEISNCNFENWKNYIESKYKIDLLEISFDTIEISTKETKIKKRNDFAFIHGDEYVYVEGYCISHKIFFDGDSDLLFLQPSQRLLTNFEYSSFSNPSQNNCGYFSIDFNYTRNEIDGNDNINEKVNNDFASKFENYKKMIQYVNDEAEKFNLNIIQQANLLLERRKEKASAFASLNAKLEIEMNVSNDSPNTTPITLKRIKRNLPVKPDNKPAKEEYEISDFDYDNINKIITLNGTTMEKTARTYYNNNEEEYRDHLIATLNTHYENASGETFRKVGKTDILIEFENKAAFIGECKIWSGEKNLSSALNQLLNYSTWRDTKCSLIIFNKKNKNFKQIIDTIDGWVTTNMKAGKKVKENVWETVYYCSKKEYNFKIHISVFDLYVDESTFKDKRKL